MTEELAEKIEGHLGSIAKSLETIAVRTPTRWEDLLERVFCSLIINAGLSPEVNQALQLVNDMELFKGGIFKEDGKL